MFLSMVQQLGSVEEFFDTMFGFIANKTDLFTQPDKTSAMINMFLKKRIDEFKDKYLKASKKMHVVHNEYVLLLCEASEFERDMRTILLPGLLEHQQAVQEDATDRWKMILQDIYRCTWVESCFFCLLSALARLPPGLCLYDLCFRLVLLSLRLNIGL